jgi:hypothetical protein
LLNKVLGLQEQPIVSNLGVACEEGYVYAVQRLRKDVREQESVPLDVLDDHQQSGDIHLIIIIFLVKLNELRLRRETDRPLRL